jgi:hypothetical protein
MKRNIFIYLFLASQSLAASDCTDALQSVSSFTQSLEAARARASSLFLECAINGPGPEKSQTLADDLKEIQNNGKGLALKGKDHCFKTEANVMAFLESAATQAGEISGMAMVACSEDAQKILRNPKLSQRKKNKQLQKLLEVE